MQHLLESFAAAVTGTGATAPVADVEAAGMDLLRRWREPHRAYHDVEHLDEVLARLDELGCDAPDVLLAAWFHDAVYEGRPGLDESASADLAAAELSALGVPRPTVDRVVGLVHVTATHEPAQRDGGAVALCDADLAVLAAEEDRYARYAADVRREYAHVDDEAFRTGRVALLRRLLERPALFRTAHGVEQWEARARGNLRRELARLDG